MTKINPKGRILMPIISVILPSVSENKKLARFCATLFAGSLDVELLICGKVGADIPEALADRIKVIAADDELTALNDALSVARGKFILLSDVSVTFADNALEKLIVASRGNASACNVGVVSADSSAKAFTQSFSFDELSSKPYYFNHLLSADVIRGNEIAPCGTDALSLMLFIADYYRYDICNTTDEVLMYTDGKAEYSAENALAFITEYANVFALTQNTAASIFFLRAVFTALLNKLNAECFEVLKSVTSLYSEDYAVLSWLKSTFAVDTAMLCDENSSFADFKNNGTGIFYKEVTLPITADAVVKNFYFGKFGVDVLKKCIGAWGYYKFYRMKDGAVKKYGCKLFLKLLGGDLDA